MKGLITLLLFISCFAGTCNKPFMAESVYSIWLKDNSGKGFSFLVSKVYPDTLIPDNYNGIRGVPANDKIPYDFHERKWSDVFENLPADTLSIFIFSNDTLLLYNWQQIRAEYKILKRYDLSRQDIEARNYTITYP